jgi:SAM-dependent methyltransferase
MKASRKIDHNWLIVEIHNNFFKSIQPDLEGVVVDLGCGRMPYRREIMDQGCKYIGVDWPNSLHGVTPDVASDLNARIDLPSASANVVLSISVLEHLHRPATMLSESWRILKPNGRLFVEVPFQWHIHEAPFDYYRFTSHGLERLLNESGFEQIEITPNGGFWTTWILKFNYQSARWIRGPRPFRWMVRLALIPIWFVGQTLATLLDRVDFNSGEAPSYAVIARKPGAPHATAEKPA